MSKAWKGVMSDVVKAMTKGSKATVTVKLKKPKKAKATGGRKYVKGSVVKKQKKVAKKVKDWFKS